MNLKATAILLVIFALAIAAFLLTRGDGAQVQPSKPNDSETKRGQTALIDPGWLGNQLTGISIKDDGRVVVELEKTAGRWRVTYPHVFAADTQAIDELLSLLAGIRGTKSDASDVGTLGHSVLSLHFAENKDAVRLAAHQRLGSGRAQIVVAGPDGAALFAADDILHQLFENLDTRAFFASSLDAPLMPTTGRVEFTRDGHASALIQQDGRWSIGEGEQKERAWDHGVPGHPGVGNYFELLDAIEIIEHQAYDQAGGLGQFGLDRPLISARFVPQGVGPDSSLETLEIRVGVPADPADQTRYVSFGRSNDASPAVFTVESRYALSLGKAATDFRDPRIVTTPRSLIHRINMTEPSGLERTFTFGADGTNTHTTYSHNAFTAALDDRACAQFLAVFTNVLASDTVELDSELPTRLLEAVLHPRIGDEAERFSIHEDPQSDAKAPTVLIRRGSEPIALRVTRSAIEPMLDPKPLFKQADAP